MSDLLRYSSKKKKKKITLCILALISSQQLCQKMPEEIGSYQHNTPPAQHTWEPLTAPVTSEQDRRPQRHRLQQPELFTALFAAGLHRELTALPFPQAS